MERKNRFTLHIVILSLVLILVDLSATVECMKSPLRKRTSTRRSDPEESLIPAIQAERVPEAINGTVACALSLAERRTEVCELAWKINQLQALLPHLHSLITNRLGRREFTFTVYMKKSSSTVQLLDDAGQALLKSLGKFVQFLGYVQKLFDATVGSSQILQEPNSRKSLFRKAMEADGFSREINDIHAVDEDEVQHLISRAWSRKCALELLKSNKDLCDIINRINILDALLESPMADTESSGRQVLAIKLYSEKLNLTDILDAIHDGLVMKMAAVHDVGARAISDRDVIYSTSVGNRRRLINEKGQEVKEVLQTSDFKVELIKKNPSDKNDNKEKNNVKSKRKLRPITDDDSEEFILPRKEQPSSIYGRRSYGRDLSGTKDTGPKDADADADADSDIVDEDDYNWLSYFDISSEEVKKSIESESKHGELKNNNNVSRKTKKYSIV